MTVRRSASHAKNPSTVDTTTTASEAPATAAPPPPLIAANPNSPISSAPIPTGGQQPPPADANIPVPPSGYVKTKSPYTAFLPKLIELAALDGAITDLKAIAASPAFVAAAPLDQEAVVAFTLALAWSRMRKVSAFWDNYALLQEGIAWATARPLLDKVRTVYELATQLDDSVPTKYANLNTLLTAKKSIAKKGVATRRRKKAAEQAAGTKPPAVTPPAPPAVK